MLHWAIRIAGRFNIIEVCAFASRRLPVTAALLLAAAAPMQLSAHEYKLGAIEIVHPWSRAVPQGAKVASGYMTLKNTGAEPDRMLSAAAEISDHVEIHVMSVDAEGVMSMRPVTDGVEIEPGQSVEFKPGAFHMMFMNLVRLPVEGQSFRATLTFQNAGSIDVEFAVDPMGPQEDHDNHEG